MSPLHEQFVSEARELIRQATDDLIAAEREGFSAERIDRFIPCFPYPKGLGWSGRASRNGTHAARGGRSACGDPGRANGTDVWRD